VGQLLKELGGVRQASWCCSLGQAGCCPLDLLLVEAFHDALELGLDGVWDLLERLTDRAARVFFFFCLY
jgi:hypothetical protein